MGRRPATTRQTEVNPYLESDKQRIAQAAEETIAQADEQRMLATRRERELGRIAGDLPDDPAALWMYTEHSLAQAAVSSIDAGRGLIKLKEILPHGEFGPALEERGISTRTANELMKVARRFSERSEKVLKLGRSKLYGCLEFGDEELDALEAGESVLDLTLDDVDRMTTRELKAAIRKGRADSEVKDKLLADKNTRIDELATENERLKGDVKRPEDSDAVQSIRQTGSAALSQVLMLRGIAARMADEGDDADPHEVAAMSACLNSIRAELALAFDLADQAAPAFQAKMEGAAVDLNGWRNFEMPEQRG